MSLPPYPPLLPTRKMPREVLWADIQPRDAVDAAAKAGAYDRLLSEDFDSRFRRALPELALSAADRLRACWELADVFVQVAELHACDRSEQSGEEDSRFTALVSPKIQSDLLAYLHPLFKEDNEKVRIRGKIAGSGPAYETAEYEIQIQTPIQTDSSKKTLAGGKTLYLTLRTRASQLQGLVDIAAEVRRPRTEYPWFWVVINVSFGFELLSTRDSLAIAYSEVFGASISLSGSADVLLAQHSVEWLRWSDEVIGIAGAEGVLVLRNVGLPRDYGGDSGSACAGSAPRFSICNPDHRILMPNDGKHFVSADVLWGGVVWWLWVFACFQRYAINVVARQAALMEYEEKRRRKQAAAALFEEVIYFENQWMYREFSNKTDIDMAYRSIATALDVFNGWEDVHQQVQVIAAEAQRERQEEVSERVGLVTKLGVGAAAVVALFGMSKEFSVAVGMHFAGVTSITGFSPSNLDWLLSPVSLFLVQFAVFLIVMWFLLQRLVWPLAPGRLRRTVASMVGEVGNAMARSLSNDRKRTVAYLVSFVVYVVLLLQIVAFVWTDNEKEKEKGTSDAANSARGLTACIPGRSDDASPQSAAIATCVRQLQTCRSGGTGPFHPSWAQLCLVQ